ncbi:histidine phosphatase family protein [Enterococcus gilvus]|uniref:histidine phosphatase family protein n=1 Tax=Enterococcus gilvus TaxID=160453 RepID=UPI001C8B2371|nr:histidine phosphatase family protein [Enterococcus gilvus]MBX8937362.1 histidine phosphatase family protein [Enterococcus gilvus]
MKIYLIRHGETEYNRRHLFYGKTDVSLNQTGIEQAYLLAEKFERLNIDAIVYTSSLQRTIETAKRIFPNQTTISLEALDEKDFGAWEGMTADQINSDFPVEWEQWLLSPFEYTPKNAERFSDFQYRILHCFEKLLQKKEDFVIVGHLGGLRTILKKCFPELDFWGIVLEQGNYTIIEAENSMFKIIEWNT